MIISVALLRLVVPGRLAGSRRWRAACRWEWSRCGGGVALLRRSGMLRWAGETDVGSPAAAVLAGGVSAAGSQLFADVGVLAAVLGAVATLRCVSLVFVGTLRLLAPALLAQLWALRRRVPSAEVGSS